MGWLNNRNFGVTFGNPWGPLGCCASSFGDNGSAYKLMQHQFGPTNGAYWPPKAPFSIVYYFPTTSVVSLRGVFLKATKFAMSKPMRHHLCEKLHWRRLHATIPMENQILVEEGAK